MRKSGSSLSQHVSAPGISSSKNVRTTGSAKRKSELSSASESMLRIETPSSRHLRFLKERDLIAPAGLESNERVIPLDFTQLSSQEVGRQHSEWAARLAHGLFETAKVAAELALAKHERTTQERLWRFRYKDDYDTIKDLDAALHSAKGFKKQARLIVNLEAELAVMESVIKGYDVLMRAASREMSRRDTERAQRD